MKSKPKTPFQQFTRAMDALIAVPHSDLKKLLNKEKRQKARKKRARTAPASHASSDKD